MKVKQLVPTIFSILWCSLPVQALPETSVEATTEKVHSSLKTAEFVISQYPSQATGTTLLNIQGQLDQNSQVLQSDGSRYNEHQFQGQAGQEVIIRMESNEFDTFLILLNTQGDIIAQADDISATNTNSVMTVILPTSGTYTIVANAFDQFGQGNYTLTVQNPSSTSPGETTATNEAPNDEVKPGFEVFRTSWFSIQHPSGSRLEDNESEISLYTSRDTMKTRIYTSSESLERFLNEYIADEGCWMGTVTRRGNVAIDGASAVRLWFDGGCHYGSTPVISTVINYNNRLVILESWYSGSNSEVSTIQDIHWSFRAQ